MRATLSGRAAVAVLTDDARTFSIGLETPPKPIAIREKDVPRLFGFSRDLEHLEDCSLQEAQRRLSELWQRDQALLHFVLILDPRVTDVHRVKCVGRLEELMADEQVTTFLEKLFYAQPLSSQADTFGFSAAAAECGAGRVSGFLARLGRSQLRIAQVQLAWERLSLELFQEDGRLERDAQVALKSEVRNALVHAGFYLEAVIHREDGAARLLQRLDDVQAPSPIHRSRLKQIVDLWVQGFAEDLGSLESTAIGRYLDDVRERLSRDQHAYFRNSEADDSDFYLPIRLWEPREARDTLPGGVPIHTAIDRFAAARRSRVDDLPRWLARSRSAAVLKGEPGAGKTTVLRQLAIDLARSRGRLIPVFVQLRTFHRWDGIETFLWQQMAGYQDDEDPSYAIPYRSLLRSLAAKGRLLFILDGLDEVDAPDRDIAYARLQAFLRAAAGVRNSAVLSCRELDYDEKLRLRELWLAPLSRRQIEQFLRRHLRSNLRENAQDYAAQLLQPVYGLDVLSQNPLSLEMLVTYLNEAKDPDGALERLLLMPDQAVLLDAFIRSRYERASTHGTLQEVTMEGFESVLGALALAGARGEKIQVGADGSEIGRVVNAAVRERILVETPGSPGELDFRHRRMREFLAARILALQEKRPDLALGRSLDAVDMEQMITLYAGMTPDPRDLVESLLRDPPDDAKHAGPLRVTLRTHRRLILAARSLGAAQGKCEDLRADVQERLQQILIDGNAAERVEAVDALQSVMPQDKYVAALSDSVDESPWVHEMALSKLQTSTVAPSALVRIARRHMDSIPFRRLLRIVWHNAHFLTIPRSAAVVFAGVLAALGRILPAVVGWPLLAMIPGLTVWSRLHWESLRGSLMVHANPNLVGVFAAGALLTALTWLLLRGVARLRWSIAMAPGLLLPSLGTNLAAERLLNGWTSVEAPALPLPPAATISARLPEFLVLRDVAVYVLTISCGVFVWRRFRDRRAAAPATSEVTAQGGSILDRGWSMLLPPFFMIAVSMLVFYYVPESPLSRPGTILGALIFLGLIVWVALYRRKQRREYLTLVNRLLLSDPNQSVDTVLTYLSGGHARKYKAGIIRVLESRLLQPGESALSEIRNFQIEPWGSAEMKDDLWKSYRILERRFLRRLDSEAA